MSIPDAQSWQDDQPLEGVQDAAFDHDGVDGSPPDGSWGEGSADAFGDPSGGNFFSAEIENVSPSDWEGDTSHIWDDSDPAAVDDHGDFGGLDFTL